MTTRTNYFAQVFDMSRFVDWCIEKDQLDLLLPNQSALNKLARQQKNLLNISGVAAVKNVKEGEDFE